MTFHDVEFTPWEAAYIADLPHRDVQKAFDEGWFDRPPGDDAGMGGERRYLGPAEVTHLRAVKDVSGAVLTNEAKKAVHRQLRKCMPDLVISVGNSTVALDCKAAAKSIARSGCYPVEPSAFVCLAILLHDIGKSNRAFQEHQYFFADGESETSFFLDAHYRDHRWGEFRSCLEAVGEKLKEPFRIGDNLLLDVFSSWKQIDDRLAKAIVAQHIVVTDPEIRGGEPVVRGTRIPAYLLHDLAEQGATEEELIADYPAIDGDRLGFVLLYTKTHPRPGRPRKMPWGSRMVGS
jgi:uncharacterized protein (DUF433 family)